MFFAARASPIVNTSAPALSSSTMMAHHRVSSDFEMSSDSGGGSEAFPAYYRREDPDAFGGGGGGAKVAAELRSPPRLTDEDVGDDRVEYVPMPEQKKLGYFSTAALIVSKMIGTGVFAKPSVVLENCGGRGVALFLWVACGLMSLAGCVVIYTRTERRLTRCRLLIYVELGITLPFSGAEVIYVGLLDGFKACSLANAAHRSKSAIRGRNT
jgi:hypothetical protein